LWGHKLNLSLKLIAHYGTFSEYTIGSFKNYMVNPSSRHTLLKNNIKSNTYVLMTNAFDLKTKPEKEQEYFYINYQ
jgi:hypothetical protein